MITEIWKEIPNSIGYYVSNLGRVRNSGSTSWNALCQCYSHQEVRILKPTYSCGYQYVGIKYIDGRTRRQRVHRLVAAAFVANPYNLPYVNHLDGCKTNNVASNLEWCDASRNTQHAYDSQLINIENFKSIRSSQATPYRLWLPTGLYVLFGSQKETLSYLGVGKSKFKSPKYQEYLYANGMRPERITKEEYFALEGSTTIPSGV